MTASDTTTATPFRISPAAPEVLRRLVRDHGYDDAALVELVITALIASTLSAVNQVFDLREGEG